MVEHPKCVPGHNIVKYRTIYYGGTRKNVIRRCKLHKIWEQTIYRNDIFIRMQKRINYISKQYISVWESMHYISERYMHKFWEKCSVSCIILYIEQYQIKYAAYDEPAASLLSLQLGPSLTGHFDPIPGTS